MTERCGEKSLVIYINIININNDSLWYYPSWLLFSLNVIFAKVLLFTCCCGFPLSTIFISIVNLFFFLYRSTFRTLFPAVLKFNTWRVTFFFFLSPFLSTLLHRLSIVCIVCLIRHFVISHAFFFFVNTRRLRSSFSFWYTSDFLYSLLFCTCDKSASTSIRGIYYTYLYKTYRHLRRL